MSLSRLAIPDRAGDENSFVIFAATARRTPLPVEQAFQSGAIIAVCCGTTRNIPL